MGDIILDQFISGRVERISPESPVPVLVQENCFEVLGGVGNVFANIRSLGGKASLASIIGCDENATLLQKLVGKEENTLLIKDKSRPTTKKIRFCSKSQHMLRVDFEDSSPISFKQEDQIINFCSGADADAVILSDYSKGVLSKRLCQSIIENFKGKVLVDPKGSDFSRFKGAKLLKLNAKEFPKTTNFFELGRSLIETLGIETCVVTMGAKGMIALSNNEVITQAPSKIREICDVSGAGDTVISVLALMCDKPLKEAIFVANTAAGIVVEKPGTSPINLGELLHEISGQKIHTPNSLKSKVRHWKQQNLKIGFTNGCFDLLHLGHLLLLQQAASHCDVLIVAINSDSSVNKIKGEGRPIHDQVTRSEIISSLSMVGATIIFDEETPLNLIKEIAPDVLIKGKDYSKEDVVGSEFVETCGGKVILVDIIEGHSTTATLKRATG